MTSFLVKLCDPQAKTPEKATPGSAGFDVAACEAAVVPPYGGRAMVDTGVALSFPEDHYVRVAPRSGLAARCGIDVLAGVVDSDFRKPIKVIMINHGTEPYVVKCGDRIAQLIPEKIADIERFEEVDEFSESTTVHAGFGSTGLSCLS